MMNRRILLTIIAMLVCLSCVPGLSVPAGIPCQLAANGKALAPIIVSPKANASVRHSAEQLRDMLQRITGAPFTVETGGGSTGLAVGLLGDFPDLPADTRLAAAMRDAGDDLTVRMTMLQSYVLQSHPKGVAIVGASEIAVEYAIWDVLYRCGYRQFFPGDLWEVVPNTPTLQVAVDTLERPDYFDRRIVYGGVETDDWAWNVRNRVGFHDFWASRKPFLPDMPAKWKQDLINNTHVYQYIVRIHADTFKAHPEWMALVNGERGKSSFLCISQPGLRDFVTQYALNWLEKNPDAWSVSLEPTDGDSWCQCDECKQMGKISNRPVLLANTAAAAIEKRYPNEPKFVGMLGYSSHWQAPDLRVHDRVVVLVTSQTLCAGEGNNPPLEERLISWAKQAKNVGVYHYASVFHWGGWLPGYPQGSDLRYLSDVMPRYHQLGARAWLAEASNSWANCGLGYYLTSRMLWDTDDAKRVDALTEDFLEKAYGPAKEPMRDYYQAIDGGHGFSSSNPNAMRSRIELMYPALLRARTLATDQSIRRRIDLLLHYTRLVELFNESLYQQKRLDLKFDNVTAEDVRESRIAFLRLAYQLRDSRVIMWSRLTDTWFKEYKLTLKDIALTDGTMPPALTDADIDALVADATRRYPAPTKQRHDGLGFTVRNGEQLLFDAEGFEKATAVAATSLETQQQAGTEIEAKPTETKQAKWMVNTTSPGDVQVTSAPASDDDPGPAEGELYCRMRRKSGTAKESGLQALFTRQTAGTVDITWMVHGNPRGDDDNAMHVILKDGATRRLALVTKITGDVCYFRDGAWQDTGLNYDGLQWQRWRVQYTPGSDHFSLTIGDKTVDNLPAVTPGPVDRVEINASKWNAKIFIDG